MTPDAPYIFDVCIGPCSPCISPYATVLHHLDTNILSHTMLSDVGVHRTWMPTLSGCWGGSPILHLVKVTLSVPQRDNYFTPFIEKNCLLPNGCGLMISYTLSKVLPLLPLTQAFMLVRLFESWVELGVLEINLVLLGGRIGLPIAKYFRIGWRVLIWLLELKPW